MEDAAPSLPKTLVLAFVAGLLPGIFLWSHTVSPIEGGLTLGFVAYFVVGGFVGHLARVPPWLSALAFVSPGILLLAWQLGHDPADARIRSVLVVVVVVAFLSTWGGRRFQRGEVEADGPPGASDAGPGDDEEG